MRHGRTRAGSDPDARDQALLQADPAVGVFVTGSEAGDTGCDGDLRLGVPMPTDNRRLHRRFAGDGRAARPSAPGEVLGKIDLRESAGKPQPAMIGNHLHLTPTSGEQRLHAFDKQFDLIVDPGGEGTLERVAELVDLPALGPRAPRRVSRVRRSEVCEARLGQEFAESVGSQRAPLGRRHGPEVVSRRYAGDLGSHWRNGRLRGCRHRGESRPSRGGRDREPAYAQKLGQALGKIEAQTIGE